MIQVRWLTAFVMLICSTSAIAGPFGVSMGQSVMSLGGKQSVTKNSFKVNVPIPNAEFESYTAISTPQTGICKIWGIGRDHDDDRAGADVKSAYHRFKELLEAKYGKSVEVDMLRANALWNEPHEWVMAINKRERTLVSFWNAEDGNSYPEGVVSISLEVKAFSSDSAYLDLTYEFTNFTRCRTIIAASQSEGL